MLQRSSPFPVTNYAHESFPSRLNSSLCWYIYCVVSCFYFIFLNILFLKSVSRIFRELVFLQTCSLVQTLEFLKIPIHWLSPLTDFNKIFANNICIFCNFNQFTGSMSSTAIRSVDKMRFRSWVHLWSGYFLWKPLSLLFFFHLYIIISISLLSRFWRRKVHLIWRTPVASAMFHLLPVCRLARGRRLFPRGWQDPVPRLPQQPIESSFTTYGRTIPSKSSTHC